MKLWQKDTNVNQEIEHFTVGRDRDMDLYLAPHDVLGSIAHTTMLESIGLIEKDELPILKKELLAIYNQAVNGDFVIEDGVEDVHSQVELMLTRKLGDLGKKIHSGRSRNDQVLVDLKLFLRQAIKEIVDAVQPLFQQLQQSSEQYKDVIIPGYTHYQVAMPSSFGLWFGAYAEALVDDMHMFRAVYKITNKNPLGSAAGYGSSFPLDRTMTTALLGFEDLNYNVVYAQMGRGKTERVVADALAALASTMSKMAQDVCLYNSQNFNFLTFPPELTTGSSIMPHKKNPDVWELIRAKSNKIQALPNTIAMITTNLASGYHRDLQEIKEGLLPVFEEMKDILALATYMLENAIVNTDAVNDEKYKYMFSVEVVNQLVLDGVSFRDAYKKVGLDIEAGNYDPPKTVNHTHEGSIGNLCTAEIGKMMDDVVGGFGFEKVERAIRELLS